MKRLLLACALVVAACSGTAGDEPTGTPDTTAPTFIAFVGGDGNISMVDPATAVTIPVTSDAGTGRLYSQPTWSPDGTRLAFVASSAPVTGIQAAGPMARVGILAQQAATGSVHIVPAGGGDPTVVTTPFVPFYLYWSPDGGNLAFLGTDTTVGRQALGIIDTAANTSERIDTGQPYYFAWAPDSDRLLVHAANRDLYYLALDGTKDDLDQRPGRFSAPSWIGDTQLFPVLEGRRQILRLFDEGGTGGRDSIDFGAAVAFELNPDEERVAYIAVEDGASPFALGPLIVDSPNGATEIAELASVFFWSADGSRLLFLTDDTSGDDFGVHWNIWDGSTSIEFERFVPTPTFVHDYLPFFGQYAHSLTFLSPDAASFTFAGSIEGRGEGIWVQPIEAGAPAELIGPGVFSTWAP